MRRATIGLFGLVLAACGGEAPRLEAVPPSEGGQRIAFQQHALACDIPGCDQIPDGVTCIQAKLEATGVEGVCPLVVGADRSVTGTCRTPAQAIRDFRLVYYTFQGIDEIQLAVVLARLDLREETRSSIVLEFPANRVMADFDDDLDQRTNIEEVCAGTNPRAMD